MSIDSMHTYTATCAVDPAPPTGISLTLAIRSNIMFILYGLARLNAATNFILILLSTIRSEDVLRSQCQILEMSVETVLAQTIISYKYCA